MKRLSKILGFVPYYLRKINPIRLWNHYCVDLAMAETMLAIAALDKQSLDRELCSTRRGSVTELSETWALRKKK